jgi:hypothetical protein
VLQATHLENWETLEEEHSNALTGCMEALESAILRVPVTGGCVCYLGCQKHHLMYHMSVACSNLTRRFSAFVERKVLPHNKSKYCSVFSYCL